MKPLSIRAAWLYLARCWERAEARGAKSATVARNKDTWGLCGSLWALKYRGVITLEQQYVMKDTMALHRPPQPAYHGFWWPRTVRGARSRAKFCRERAAGASA